MIMKDILTTFCLWYITGLERPEFMAKGMLIDSLTVERSRAILFAVN